MTREELKKLNRKIATIKDPLGEGFPSLLRIFEEVATKADVNEFDVLHEYIIWKRSRK